MFFCKPCLLKHRYVWQSDLKLQKFDPVLNQGYFNQWKLKTINGLLSINNWRILFIDFIIPKELIVIIFKLYYKVEFMSTEEQYLLICEEKQCITEWYSSVDPSTKKRGYHCSTNGCHKIMTHTISQFKKCGRCRLYYCGEKHHCSIGITGNCLSCDEAISLLM
jgi:hypothetical protein